MDDVTLLTAYGKRQGLLIDREEDWTLRAVAVVSIGFAVGCLMPYESGAQLPPSGQAVEQDPVVPQC